MSRTDKLARSERSRRQTVIASLRATANTLVNRHDRIAVNALAADLEAVSRDSSLTGAEKERRFRALCERLNKPSTPIV